MGNNLNSLLRLAPEIAVKRNLTFNFLIIWENGTPNKRTFGTRLLILVQKMKAIRNMCL